MTLWAFGFEAIGVIEGSNFKLLCLNHPLRVLVMSCQSRKNKKAELNTIMNSEKTDIIFGNESWLTPDIKNSEIFPDSFGVVRKDIASDAYGGVFIAFKHDLLCTETPNWTPTVK